MHTTVALGKNNNKTVETIWGGTRGSAGRVSHGWVSVDHPAPQPGASLSFARWIGAKKESRIVEQGSLKDLDFACPIDTCGFFNTKIKGNHHLRGNVQVYNVRIPVEQSAQLIRVEFASMQPGMSRLGWCVFQHSCATLNDRRKLGQ